MAGALVAATVLLVVIARPFAEDAVREVALPLRHEDIIRQQAEAKDLDPSLIAGVIYVESRFRDQTSVAGAKGLMQILPSTADYIAHKSGGTAFEQGDLATPQINIAYGSWYLRYLLAALRGQRAAGAGRLQRGRGQGRRVVPRRVGARRGVRGGDAHPVPRDAQLRRAGARRAGALPAGVQEGAGLVNERSLGRTGLTVSEIGYGAWGIGGDMWLGAEDQESLQPRSTTRSTGA